MLRKSDFKFKRRDVDGDGVLNAEEYDMLFSKLKRAREAKEKLSEPEVMEEPVVVLESRLIAEPKLLTEPPVIAEPEVLTESGEIVDETPELVLEEEVASPTFGIALELQRASGVILCDTRVVTSAGPVVGRMAGMKDNNDVLLEIYPGIYFPIQASEIQGIEKVALEDECNRTARKKVGK